MVLEIRIYSVQPSELIRSNTKYSNKSKSPRPNRAVFSVFPTDPDDYSARIGFGRNYKVCYFHYIQSSTVSTLAAQVNSHRIGWSNSFIFSYLFWKFSDFMLGLRFHLGIEWSVNSSLNTLRPFLLCHLKFILNISFAFIKAQFHLIFGNEISSQRMICIL